MKKMYFVLLLFPFSLLAQELECLDCELNVPVSYNNYTATVYSPGADIKANTRPVCPYGIQIAAYSALQNGPTNTICTKQGGLYCYFLVGEYFETIEEAKHRIKVLGVKGMPKKIKGFLIFKTIKQEL
jgi:hypothetical protein